MRRHFDQIRAAYEASTVPSTKKTLLLSLAAARSTVRLQEVLDYSLSDAVRNQDTVQLVDSVARNPLGSQLAWTFLKANWDTFINRKLSSSLVACVPSRS